MFLFFYNRCRDGPGKYYNKSLCDEGNKMRDDLRAYYKPEGTNLEINSGHYELSSCEIISGTWNFDPISFSYTPGIMTGNLRFRAIDQDKPIVLALEGVVSSYRFVVIDAHLDPNKAEGGMFNFREHTSD